MSAIAKFATKGVAADDRLRYWNTVADEVFCGTFVNAESQRFEGEMWSWSVGELDMIRTRSVAAYVGRKPVQRDEERVIMHMQWRGTGQHSQGGRDTQLDTGDFVIGSPHHPYHFDLAPHEMMVVEFPKDALAERIPDLEDVLARRLSGKSPAARVFNDFLLSLWRQAESAAGDDPEWSKGINRVFYDLAALAIRDARQQGQASGHEIELRRRAQRIIDAMLSDPALRSTTIANELGVSVRTVQSLFASCGTTPSAAILDRRLERAAEQLIAAPGATITDIAFAHGFNDSAYFTRCFGQKYGVSPREWRLGRNVS